MPSGFGKCSNYLSFLLQLDFAMNTCKGLPSNSKIFYFLLASPDLQVLMISMVTLEPSFLVCLLLWKRRGDLSCFVTLGLQEMPPCQTPQETATLRNIYSLFFEVFQRSPLKKNPLYLSDKGQK